MKLSPFFAEMKSAYEAELEDLSTDSAGKDVLDERLRTKRGQLAQLLPMLEVSPEMVAAAFHGGVFFTQPQVISELVGREPHTLPSWTAIGDAVRLTPWAEKLAEIVLGDAAGDRFLVIAACLEYLHGRPDSSSQALTEESADDADGDDAGEDGDLADDGADWLAEQGFERRDRFSGD
ncbi:MAG TPA: hypothetical protein PKA30_15965 [Accumulibacter sp.]|uniref:hypothetical protein n=1 Tax=Accumulibacter sp. TaxID=2053492 RepID=UPI002878480A|nr:hypothetical protein [Accumulibacter sp.]MDS4056673.1 hypothetical protein [Accumulibacter sp.]HMV07028.1 hypothetical protein [Accumulibacter sp.]HMW63272.1 hypothetical protein [Accumulibacter sp.]HMW79217.1 hypothetical protein [Accumulibacter sp.]HMX67396.1 hypothetical protein [Accumulibacter sp.]